MHASDRGLLDVSRFLIGEDILQWTLEALKRVGQSGAEGFVLWSGIRTDEKTFQYMNAIIPPQQALRRPDGLMVLVGGNALFEVNKLAYERGEILAAQVHTHPSGAFHSGTDDHFPLVTLLGAVSLVIPHFAKNAPGDMAEWAWYRLTGYGVWTLVDDTTEVIIQ
jgi:hypothetical protein